MGQKARFQQIALLLICSTAIGCGVNEVPVVPVNPPPLEQATAAPPKLVVDERVSAEASWGPVLKAKIKVKDGSGKDVFSIKPKDDGAKLVGVKDQEIARFHLTGDKLKIKDGSDKVLGYVVGTGGKYHLKDPEQKNVLFELHRQADGDWKLEDGHETLIYRIKKRDYGYEIQDHLEVTLAKVKTKDGKVEVLDTTDHLLYATASTVVGPLPLACLSLDKVGDLPIRAGLMIRIALEDSLVPKPEGEAKK